MRGGGGGFRNCLKVGADSSGAAVKAKTAYPHKLTGQYLIGNIAVGIYLMESTGSIEDWWPAAEQQTFNEIVEGLDWLAEQGFQRGAKVVWVYAPMETVSTSVEPIVGQSMPYHDILGWHFGWLNDIYSAHSLSNEWDGAYGLANQLRQTYSTNWALEVVVVMDENDSDHMFANEQFAYVTLDGSRPGPFAIMTYHNDGWGQSQMSDVIAHEASHVFGASDEYNIDENGPPQCHESDDCGPQNSYLQTDNGNCAVCNPNSVNCYMKGRPGYVCAYTPPELGWRDYWLPNNEVMDPVDQNSERWMSIYPAAAGDIIRITELGGNFANVFVVSPDMLFGASNNIVFWDGVNYKDELVASPLCIVNKNGSDMGTFQLHFSTPSTYAVSGHSFGFDTLSFGLPNIAMCLRHTIYDSLGNVFARPTFDVMKSNLAVIHQDIAGYPDGIYTSEVYGHRSCGDQTNVSTLTFINYICGDLDDDSLVTQGDLTILIDHLFITLEPLKHLAAADLDGCDEVVSMGDMTVLIDHLFVSLDPLECCHSLDSYAFKRQVSPERLRDLEAVAGMNVVRPASR